MKKIISMILILCSTASFVNITSATSELIPTPKKAPYTESITVEFSTNEIKTKREVFNDIRTLVVSEILRLHIPAKFKRTPY